jgi:ferredoxin-NADP reductase
VCGPGAFMDAVTDAALSLGVPADHMYQESFSF